MEEKRAPFWIPYSTPPQTRSEQAVATLKRYGFPVALVLALLILIGGIIWFVPQAGPPALDAVGANLQPEEPDRSRLNNPYAGEAKLSVRSQPSGALVLVGEDTLGITPLRQRAVSAGAHLISVQKEGYAGIDSVIILRSDRPTTFYARLVQPAERYEAPRQEDYDPPADQPAARREQQSEALPQPQTTAQTKQAPPQSPPETQPTAPSSQEEARAEAALERAEEQLKAANYEAARDAFREVLELTPDNAYAAGKLNELDAMFRNQQRTQQYEEALRQGNELFVEERYEEALAAYTEALGARPGDARAEERLRRTRERLVEEKRRAEQYQYHRARGDVLFEQERYEEAAQDYEQALEYRPGDTYARDLLQQSRQRAEESSERLIERQAVELPTQERETDNPEAEEPNTGAVSARMNLNTATAAQLQRLPGIGPVLSQRILEYRATHGPFKRVGDLERVRGIGPKRLADIRPYVFVEAP